MVYIDDIRLISCSNFLKIKSIALFAKDYVCAIFIEYILPNGQLIKSVHIPVEDTDEEIIKFLANGIYSQDSLSLDKDEYITSVSSAKDKEGITKLNIKTSSDRNLSVAGSKYSETHNTEELNLEMEQMILVGFKTHLTDYLVDIACYTATYKMIDLSDIGEQPIFNRLLSDTTLDSEGKMKPRGKKPRKRVSFNTRIRIKKKRGKAKRTKKLPTQIPGKEDPLRLSVIKEEEGVEGADDITPTNLNNVNSASFRLQQVSM